MTAIRLLLVDDDAELSSLLKIRLEKTGRFTVECIDDPRVAHARAKSLGAKNIGLFLLDIDMPHISGGQLAEILNEDPALSAIPILFLSSLVSPHEASHTQSLRHPIVSKGNTVRELIEAIDKRLA